ncbi:MAG: hypothetical protein IT457_11840 [Planctomycetes bacterium]|nr:hypothetical protein [Planctomycetota bacterium]
MHPIARLCLAALLCTSALVAQTGPVKSAGCPGAAPLKTSGAARLGQALVIESASCGRGAAGFFAIGIPSEPAIRLEGTPLCAPGRICVLVVEPIHVAVDTNSFRFDVPNVPGLAGLGFRVQGGCFDRAAGCITLGAAVDVVIES